MNLFSGYTTDANCTSARGFVNPLSFITTTYPFNESTSGIFDGAGSLVRPQKSCYGCDKDIATMHPHNGIGSTVVFQWRYDENSCDHVDITSDQLIDVVIQSKGWADHLTEKSISGSISKYSSISLAKSSNSTWTTFAVTSKSPISFANNISATCKTTSSPLSTGTSITNNLVDVTYDYFWTGTGSLISGLMSSDSGVGVDNDIAVTFSTKKSLTSFQWLSSDSCQNIELSGSNYNSDADVQVKIWNQPNDSYQYRCSYFPCTVWGVQNNAYHVIKIKSDAGAVGGRINARCK